MDSILAGTTIVVLYLTRLQVTVLPATVRTLESTSINWMRLWVSHPNPHLHRPYVLGSVGNISTLRRLSGVRRSPDVICHSQTPPPGGLRSRPIAGFRRRAQERFQMLADHLMEHGVLGVSRMIHGHDT